VSRLAPRPFSAAIADFTKAARPVTTLARVQQAWRSAAGSAISAAARPTAERDGVLTITCEAAVWAQELDLMAPELIRRLNSELGEESVRELRCRTA